MNSRNLININKRISSAGICSRRQADKLIAEGKVKINGIIAKLGNRVGEGDLIEVDGKKLKDNSKKLYFAFFKPRGIVCTTEKKEKMNIVDYINYPERLFPIGRLDKMSEGLILLTNDGEIVNGILKARYKHEKEYLVEVNKKITPTFIEKLSSGVQILGIKTRKCFVEKINDFSFRIILTQGINRQIRRMCEQLGYKVKNLKRTRIMNIKLNNLQLGQLKPLTKTEIQEIMEKIKKND